MMVGGGLSVTLVACAMGAPAELAPDVDPNLPGLDASNNPLPGHNDDTDPRGSRGSRGEVGDGSTGAPEPPIDASAEATVAPVTAPKPAAGEVLITEVMYATAGPEPASEWLELHSLVTSERTLAGLVLKDASARSHVIVGPLSIGANGWVVLARNKAAAITAKVPASVIVYEYGTGLGDNSGILLANGSTGGISLLSGATVIASAPYGGWFSASGRSLQLKVMDATQASLKASWCLSPTAWTAGSEKGTPGYACDCL